MHLQVLRTIQALVAYVIRSRGSINSPATWTPADILLWHEGRNLYVGLFRGDELEAQMDELLGDRRGKISESLAELMGTNDACLYALI